MAGPRAEDFRNFAIVAGPDSPLYGHVCDAIAGSPELLELAATSSEPMANLFLAAIHAELLRDPDVLNGDYSIKWLEDWLARRGG